MNEEEKESGFKIQDRRRFNPDGTPRGESTPDAPSEGQGTAQEETMRKAPPQTPRSPEGRGEESTATGGGARQEPQEGETPGRKSWKERLFGGRKKEGEEGAQRPPQEEGPLPEIDFPTFLLSLQSAALFHLGILPDPQSGKREVNLPQAKQTIDILGILEEKTKGNLTKEEEEILTRILTDLRLTYVKVQG